MLSAEDRLAIMDLSARYCHATDSHNAEAWADTFTADGAIEAPQGVSQGRDALIQFSQGVNTNMPTVRHHVSNLVIDGDGDSATMSSYLNLINTDGNATVFTAMYEDQLSRVDGEWKFAHRKIVV
ncbi:MAG: nuclear transport factor 2 family protein [Chloroflexota bacterium]|nr:nuclear transport factor 2 family protein [Chloroflexota bacterium]MDE2932322.1 nuclear transport factor 2 family protein [Chloroflexota bacterium]